jgi:hypothetical protein
VLQATTKATPTLDLDRIGEFYRRDRSQRASVKDFEH